MKKYKDIAKYNTLEHFKMWKQKAHGKRVCWVSLQYVDNGRNALSYYGQINTNTTHERIDSLNGYIKFRTYGSQNEWNFLQRGENYFWWIEGIGFYFPDDIVKIENEVDYYKWLASR